KLYAELANSHTEIERKSQELLEAKEFTDDIIRSMINALIVVDSRRNVKMVNQATLDLLGYKEEEIVGKPIEAFLASNEADKNTFKTTLLEKLGSKGSIRNLEINCRDKSGKEIPVSFSISAIKNSQGDIVGAVIVVQDLRQTKKLLAEATAAAQAERAKAIELAKAYKELQQLQTQLIQSEKMASLGKLAAGIAHEINNPLTGVLTFAHFLLKKIDKNDPKREDLEVIVEGTTRCKRIVEGLLNFARQKEPQKSPCNINEVIEESLSLVEKQASFHNIKIIRELDRSLPQITVDVDQIQQVFMNIILNAQEAMPEGGFLTITTSMVDGGQFVEIKFVDTGCGIKEEDIHRVFDPFFTTKKETKGTGLGLAVSYGIIERHKGTIEVCSELGKGSTFIVKLPVKEEIKYAK
ncbi:MAG TPA: PAS domain S-box protein, partial [bacterium (Candidatus Stahlbacteria)]|nr:PAS domain S-box protein [Candidatus Stahlbacteria bacterium]